jgi:dienelactone hydrolase
MYDHLGIYSDWVEEANKQLDLYPKVQPGENARQQIRELLGFSREPELPHNVICVDEWEKDGVFGQEISWSVGYGPRTQAWFLRPVGKNKPLPGILALHDHGGFKYWGKEKIAAGKNEPHPGMIDYWDVYGGRPWANALVREGYAVLIHDTFLWGSRGFPIETMLKAMDGSQFPAESDKDNCENPIPAEAIIYNHVAAQYEHVVEKYCTLLGTSMAGVVAHEDRIALNYLRSRSEVDLQHTACIGLSGGGNRAALLMATAEHLSAGVIVGLMSTYDGLLDHNVACHTWMLFPRGWARFGDWPDLAGSRAPAPLLVQYDNEDPLFTLEGMRAADRRLAEIYTFTGMPAAYTGQFFPGPHKFDLEMQRKSFDWLAGVLKPSG